MNGTRGELEMTLAITATTWHGMSLFSDHWPITLVDEARDPRPLPPHPGSPPRNPIRAFGVWFSAGYEGPAGCGHVAPIGIRPAIRLMGSG
jgi:hypothetical protein